MMPESHVTSEGRSNNVLRLIKLGAITENFLPRVAEIGKENVTIVMRFFELAFEGKGHILELDFLTSRFTKASKLNI